MEESTDSKDHVPVLTRPCTKCGDDKSISEFHKAKYGKYGVTSVCKACLSEIYKIKNAKNTEVRAEKRRNRTPEEVAIHKAKTHEYYLKNRASICSKSAAYANLPESKEKIKLSKRLYRENNPDKTKAYNIKKMLNRDPVEESKRLRVYYLNNREYIIDKINTWVANNKDKSRAYKRNYEARKINAEGFHTGDDIYELLMSQDNLCVYCGKELVSYHVDHIFPLVLGGSNWPSNLQVLCPSCNCSKKAKTHEEFLLYMEKVVIPAQEAFNVTVH